MKDNFCVIMGGGIGSRFWPFSREDKPKQFLDFFGTGRSLLQQTFDRFSQIIPTENIFIATNDAYADLVKEQLPEITDKQILREPTRRNTAPCIAYAAFHIKAINPNANIVVTPADHLILQEHHFLKNIQTGLNFVREYPALLTLGVKPERPETGYGYIQTDEGVGGGNIQKVKVFTEKPNLELAELFVKSGDFFWNSGIFLWNVNTILKAFEEHLPAVHNRLGQDLDKYNTPEEQKFINEAYPTCPNISIDYGIMEKANNVHMLVADFGWSDLGNWSSIYDLTVDEKDESKNATLKCKSLFIDSSNNLVTTNSDNKLVVVQGLKNYIVVESDNILLICKREEEQRIKQIVADIEIKFGKEYI
ncbi:mannose-1-phosphate guanylyltransferase [Dysgonomonadaceae bacterium PH5-43]|nr:mannose-1-phosphate guanylyltransferase [Dysgonomonadaceae bacterium PH5-43]